MPHSSYINLKNLYTNFTHYKLTKQYLCYINITIEDTLVYVLTEDHYETHTKPAFLSALVHIISMNSFNSKYKGTQTDSGNLVLSQQCIAWNDFNVG